MNKTLGEPQWRHVGFWRREKPLASTGIRTPDCIARILFSKPTRPTRPTVVHVPEWMYSYIVGSKSFRPDQLFKVTEIKTTLLFFNIVFLYFNTLFNWYINLTIDGTIYPLQHFPFGAAFVCQAGNFWNLLRTYLVHGTESFLRS